MTEAVQPFIQDTPPPVDMPAPIIPTVGRVVHYWPHAGDMAHNADQPLAAIVTYVWSYTGVNLCVFDANGVPHSKTSVTLVQSGHLAPQAGYCEWMPYQKGQAAKTEAMERMLGMGQTIGNGIDDGKADGLIDAMASSPASGSYPGTDDAAAEGLGAPLVSGDSWHADDGGNAAAPAQTE